jgi:hypothetical protein
MIIFVANPFVITVLGMIFPDKLFYDCSIVIQIILPFATTIFIIGACLLIGELLTKMKLDGKII